MRVMQGFVSVIVAWSALAGTVCAAEQIRVPASTHNLLVDAQISGNLESYDKGLRGERDHMVYDLNKRHLGLLFRYSTGLRPIRTRPGCTTTKQPRSCSPFSLIRVNTV